VCPVDFFIFASKFAFNQLLPSS